MVRNWWYRYVCIHTYVYVHLSEWLYVFVYHFRTKVDGNCTHQMTSCNACYYAREERPLPSECRTNLKKYRCAGKTGSKLKKCLQRWGKCLKKAFRLKYRKVCWYVHAVCVAVII